MLRLAIVAARLHLRSRPLARSRFIGLAAARSRMSQIALLCSFHRRPAHIGHVISQLLHVRMATVEFAEVSWHPLSSLTSLVAPRTRSLSELLAREATTRSKTANLPLLKADG